MAQNGLRQPTTDTPTTSHTSPDADHTFRLLADDERRVLLATVDDEECVGVDRLRDRLAETPEDRDHAAIRLHHVHLPKLADAGLLVHDETAGDVVATERGRQVASTFSVDH